MLAQKDVMRPNPWRMIDTFTTAEAAEPVMQKLRNQGFEAQLTLIGGLSVIARRVHTVPMKKAVTYDAADSVDRLAERRNPARF